MAAARYELEDRARQRAAKMIAATSMASSRGHLETQQRRLEGMNNKIRLLSHRSFGLHSAEALISLVYLNCGGLTLERIH